MLNVPSEHHEVLLPPRCDRSQVHMENSIFLKIKAYSVFNFILQTQQEIILQISKVFLSTMNIWYILDAHHPYSIGVSV